MDPECVSEIVKGLYLGDLKAATSNELITSLNITRIISLDVTQPILSVQSSNLFIQVSDELHSDLLSHLPSCVDFIQRCLSLGEAVLVHCRHGVSRSATVVVAYLMKTLKQDRDTALQTVRESRQCADPNSGFMDQLRLFGEMSCSIEPSNVKYKLYEMEKCSLEFTSGGQGDKFKCRQCRVVLACHTDVLPHKEGHGPDWRTGSPGAVKGGHGPDWRTDSPGAVKEGHAPDWRTDSPGAVKGGHGPDWRTDSPGAVKEGHGPDWRTDSPGAVKEGHGPDWRTDAPGAVKGGHGPDWRTDAPGALCGKALFVAPKEWMKSQIVGPGGRLLCGKCKAKLGAWSIGGEGVRCPCGASLTRGFLINLSKVDLSRVNANL